MPSKKERFLMDEQLQEILTQCSVDTRITAETFFPERFYMPFAEEVHGKIFDLIDGTGDAAAEANNIGGAGEMIDA